MPFETEGLKQIIEAHKREVGEIALYEDLQQAGLKKEKLPKISAHPMLSCQSKEKKQGQPNKNILGNRVDEEGKVGV